MLEPELVAAVLDKVVTMVKADLVQAHISGGSRLDLVLSRGGVAQLQRAESLWLDLYVARRNRAGWWHGWGRTCHLDDAALKDFSVRVRNNLTATPFAPAIEAPSETPLRTSSFDSLLQRSDTPYALHGMADALLAAEGEKLAFDAGYALRVGGWDAALQPLPFALKNNQGAYLLDPTTTVRTQVALRRPRDGQVLANVWREGHRRHQVQLPAEGLAPGFARQNWVAHPLAACQPTALLLEPPAAALLVSQVVADFSASALHHGAGLVARRLGQSLAAPSMHIACRASHALHGGPRFDVDGLPTQDVDLIRDGQWVGVVRSRASGHRDGASGTGHGVDRWGAEAVRFPVVEDHAADDSSLGMDTSVLLQVPWLRLEAVPGTPWVHLFCDGGGRLVVDGEDAALVAPFAMLVDLRAWLATVRGMGAAALALGVVTPSLLCPWHPEVVEGAQ